MPHLFSDTLRENILLGLSEQTVDLARAIHMTVLEQDIVTLKDGLDTLIGVRGVKLSDGQIQRTGIARMLLREPDLLICDDLSSALDVETEQTLWERLTTTTCIVVSHRRSVLQRADQVIVLKDGHIEAERPPENSTGELRRDALYLAWTKYKVNKKVFSSLTIFLSDNEAHRTQSWRNRADLIIYDSRLLSSRN